jgi:hypothetical protein
MSDPDYRLFDLAGEPYEVGRALGAATAPFAVPAWWPPPPGLEFARACEALIAELCPAIVEELHGYADAQRVPYTDLLRGVCRRSMRLRGRPPAYPEGGCTAFAAARAGGPVLAGRNYDFHPVQRIRQRIRLAPAAGLASAGARGSVPGGRYDGVNAAGLFISLHVVLADEPAEHRPGIPFHLVPRIVLETCANVAEALDWLLRLPHLHSFNYLLADRSGGLAVVEAHPLGVRALEPEMAAGAAYAAATNHFRHPDMRGFQRGRKLDHSQGRWNRLKALVAAPEALTFAAIPRLLADHAGPICGHSGGHTTLWSLAVDLTQGWLAYAAGPACLAAFEPVAWPGGERPPTWTAERPSRPCATSTQ